MKKIKHPWKEHRSIKYKWGLSISHFIYKISYIFAASKHRNLVSKAIKLQHLNVKPKKKTTCGICQALFISNLEAAKICHKQEKKKKNMQVNSTTHTHIKTHIQKKEIDITYLFVRIDETNTNVSPVTLGSIIHGRWCIGIGECIRFSVFEGFWLWSESGSDRDLNLGELIKRENRCHDKLSITHPVAVLWPLTWQNGQVESMGSKLRE